MARIRIHAEERISASDILGSLLLVFRHPYLETFLKRTVIVLTCAVHPYRDLVCPLYATTAELKQAPGVLSTGTLCMLCIIYLFLFLMFDHILLCRQPHKHTFGITPITTLNYTQEEGDVLLAYLHVSQHCFL